MHYIYITHKRPTIPRFIGLSMALYYHLHTHTTAAPVCKREGPITAISKYSAFQGRIHSTERWKLWDTERAGDRKLMSLRLSKWRLASIP